MPGEPPASRPAAIAQTAERTPRKRQVAGSCPARGSNGSRAPSGAGPSLPLAPSRTASLSLTAGPTFAGMGRPIRFFRGRRPAAGRLVRNEEVAGSNPAGSTTCGMPPRVSADIPRNDVMSRRRAPAMEYADSGLPPAARETAGPAGPSTGRPHKPRVMGPDPVPRDADVVQWQHACFPSRRPRVRTPSSALSGKPRQWIRSNNGTRNRPFHVDASGENMDEQPRHGHAASRNKETCHRPGSSEEEQVPFKHWVRIS